MKRARHRNGRRLGRDEIEKGNIGILLVYRAKGEAWKAAGRQRREENE